MYICGYSIKSQYLQYFLYHIHLFSLCVESLLNVANSILDISFHLLHDYHNQVVIVSLEVKALKLETVTDEVGTHFQWFCVVADTLLTAGGSTWHLFLKTLFGQNYLEHW
jgi:hypothetical protein